MRCLVISDTFPNRLQPWRGPYNRRQIECLARRCEITVVGPLPWPRLFTSIDVWRLTASRDTLLEEVTLYHPLFFYLPLLGRDRTWRGVLSATKRAIRRDSRKYDVILSTFAYPHGLAAKYLSNQMGIPYVIKARGSDLHSLPAGTMRRDLTANALQGASAIIAVSRNLAEIASGLGAEKSLIHLLPNGIDAEEFRCIPREEARKTLKVPFDTHIVVFIGNLLPVKGVDVLMDAISALSTKSTAGNRLFALAGEGPLKGWVRRRISEENLQGSVRLIGHISRSDVTLWMNAADLLVLPSRNEGCPNVVLEALCCGTPVVASCVGAVPDLLDATCGIIIKPDNVDALAAGIESALERDWNRTVLRRRVEGMSWQSNADTLHNILMKVIGSNSGNQV